MAGSQRTGCHASAARHRRLKSANHRVVATIAGQNQIFVEGRFHGARIRKPQHSAGGFEIVREAQAWFALRRPCQSVIFVYAQTQIESPIPNGNRILQEESELLNIGVSVEPIQSAGRMRTAIRGRQRSRSGEVVTSQQRQEIRIRLQSPSAVIRIRQRRVGVRASVRVQTRCIGCRIHQAKRIAFGNECLPIRGSYFNVLIVGHIRIIQARRSIS